MQNYIASVQIDVSRNFANSTGPAGSPAWRGRGGRVLGNGAGPARGSGVRGPCATVRDKLRSRKPRAGAGVRCPPGRVLGGIGPGADRLYWEAPSTPPPSGRRWRPGARVACVRRSDSVEYPAARAGPGPAPRPLNQSTGARGGRHGRPAPARSAGAGPGPPSRPAPPPAPRPPPHPPTAPAAPPPPAPAGPRRPRPAPGPRHGSADPVLPQVPPLRPSRARLPARAPPALGRPQARAATRVSWPPSAGRGGRAGGPGRRGARSPGPPARPAPPSGPGWARASRPGGPCSRRRCWMRWCRCTSRTAPPALRPTASVPRTWAWNGPPSPRPSTTASVPRTARARAAGSRLGEGQLPGARASAGVQGGAAAVASQPQWQTRPCHQPPDWPCAGNRRSAGVPGALLCSCFKLPRPCMELDVRTSQIRHIRHIQDAGALPTY